MVKRVKRILEVGGVHGGQVATNFTGCPSLVYGVAKILLNLFLSVFFVPTNSPYFQTLQLCLVARRQTKPRKSNQKKVARIHQVWQADPRTAHMEYVDYVVGVFLGLHMFACLMAMCAICIQDVLTDASEMGVRRSAARIADAIFDKEAK